MSAAELLPLAPRQRTWPSCVKPKVRKSPYARGAALTPRCALEPPRRPFEPSLQAVVNLRRTLILFAYSHDRVRLETQRLQYWGQVYHDTEVRLGGATTARFTLQALCPVVAALNMLERLVENSDGLLKDLGYRPASAPRQELAQSARTLSLRRMSLQNLENSERRHLDSLSR